MKKCLLIIPSIFCFLFGTIFISSLTVTNKEYIAKRITSNTQIQIDQNNHSGEGMLSTKDSHLNYCFSKKMLRNYKLFYESFKSESFCPVLIDENPVNVIINDVGKGAEYLNLNIVYGKDSILENEIICNKYTATYYGINSDSLPFEIEIESLSYNKKSTRKMVITGVFEDNKYTKPREESIKSDFTFVSHSINLKNTIRGFKAYIVPVNPNYFANWSVLNVIDFKEQGFSFVFSDSTLNNNTNNYLTCLLNLECKINNIAISIIFGFLFLFSESSYIYTLYKKGRFSRFDLFHSLLISTFALVIFNNIFTFNLISVFALVSTIILFVLNMYCEKFILIFRNELTI